MRYLGKLGVVFGLSGGKLLLILSSDVGNLGLALLGGGGELGLELGGVLGKLGVGLVGYLRNLLFTREGYLCQLLFTLLSYLGELLVVLSLESIDLGARLVRKRGDAIVVLASELVDPLLVGDVGVLELMKPVLLSARVVLLEALDLRAEALVLGNERFLVSAVL